MASFHNDQADVITASTILIILITTLFWTNLPLKIPPVITGLPMNDVVVLFSNHQADPPGVVPPNRW